MENNSEILNNNILYNDNYIQNYEELACCSNSIITTFIQENGANLLHFINDLCFRNVEIDDEAQIINDPKQKLKTPLCSSNKKVNKGMETYDPNFDNLINNSINNNIINNIDNKNNNNVKKNLNNSLMHERNNMSNEEAPEPIVSSKKVDKYINDDEENNNIVVPNKNSKKVNLYRNKSNIFNVIKEAFKDFFSEKKEEDENDEIGSGSEMNINLKKRPVLKKIIENDIITPLQAYENIIPIKNKDDVNNILKHANSQLFRRPQLFSDDILSFNISEDNNNEALTKLVSYIPVFTVKKKIKSNEDNIRCTICLSEFEIGEKKSTLPCMHSFHCNCIERWIKKKNYCPICKFKISFENLRESLEKNYK